MVNHFSCAGTQSELVLHLGCELVGWLDDWPSSSWFELWNWLNWLLLDWLNWLDVDWLNWLDGGWLNWLDWWLGCDWSTRRGTWYTCLAGLDSLQRKLSYFLPERYVKFDFKLGQDLCRGWNLFCWVDFWMRLLNIPFMFAGSIQHKCLHSV